MKFSPKRRFGDVGENLACAFLMKRGIKIIFKNYLKPWGEIDIIGFKNGTYHFVEVKSVSGLVKAEGTFENVIHETDRFVQPTNQNDLFRPEENVHPKKLQRLHRTIESYLLENNIENDWQLDVVTVKMDETTRRARIEILENVIGE